MLKEAFQALRLAERPVLIFGAGVRGTDAASLAWALAALTGVPVAPTWAARDLFPFDDRDVLCVGASGTHGTRSANFAVQNADWILSVGSRLDSKTTGTPREYFARAASVFMVDIDAAEIAKFHGQLGRQFHGAQADAALFLRDALELVSSLPDYRAQFMNWRTQCQKWLREYPACRPEYEAEEGVNPYVFVRELSDRCDPREIIVSDTGLALAWMMQGFEFKEGQRFVHAFNQTPMGYGLPAAIGAAFAHPGQRVVLVTGDGGFMLNIQELAVVAKHDLPIKILLINNAGHAMCRQTQEQWLGGKYYSTSVEHGLAFPDFCDVATGYWIRNRRLSTNATIRNELSWAFRDRNSLEYHAPTLLEVVVDGGHRLIPQVAYGRPNEDGGPPLPRDELREQMIVGVVD